jgi:hypothetical protein
MRCCLGTLGGVLSVSPSLPWVTLLLAHRLIVSAMNGMLVAEDREDFVMSDENPEWDNEGKLVF